MSVFDHRAATGIVQELEALESVRGHRRVAMVVRTEMDELVLKMFMVLARDLSAEFAVFRTLDAAEAWVQHPLPPPACFANSTSNLVA